MLTLGPATKAALILATAVAWAAGAPLHGGQGPAARGEEVGYIQDLHGVWVDDAYSGPALAIHSVVRRDSRIRLTASRRDYFLRVRFYGLTEVTDFSCTKLETCPGPLDLQGELNRRDPKILVQFKRVIEALKAMLIETPPGGENLISRGAGQEGGPRDAVVVAGEAEVSAVFRDLPFDRYKATLNPLTGERALRTVDLRWSDDRRVKLALAPGLYDVRLERGTKGASRGLPPENCMILAARKKDYNGAVSLLKQGSDYATTWKDANPAEVNTMQRYLMLSVARGLKP